MFPPAPLARLALAAGLALHAAGAPAQAQKTVVAAAPAAAAPAAPQSACARVQVGAPVQIAVGKSSVLRPAAPVTRIVLGNPENARAARPAEADGRKDAQAGLPPQPSAQRPGVAEVDVLVLAPTEVYLLGKTVGSTNIVMLDKTGTCTAYDVVVGMDTLALQSVIGQMLPAEKDLKVTAAFDSIVLSGTVSDGEAMARLLDLANAYVRSSNAADAKANPRIVNMVEVGAPQQVMLEVKVAEISKSLLDTFGIDFARAYAVDNGGALRYLSGILGGTSGLVGNISGTTGAKVGAGAIGLASNGQATSGFSAQVGDAQFGDNPVIPLAAGNNLSQTKLNMQKTDGLVKVLAEPTVMAISGQTGSFLAGGKIFIPVSQDNATGGRTITLEEKEFGVSVRFTPTVLGGGRINLRVRPEVSELNATGVQISAGGINAVLPSFTSRKAETTVQLMDGQSFAIGGLIKNNATTNIRAFPVLGELPVIGALFRSTQFQTDRSELVFVITPRLVRPLPAGYALPTDKYVPPTRGELVFDGRLEGRAGSADEGGFDREKK